MRMLSGSIRIGSMCLIALSVSTASAAITFDESQPDRVRFWNDDYYEMAFRKSDGRLLYITDKTTNQQVSTGNLFGPFFMQFSNGTSLDGSNFSPGNANRTFSYSWDDSEKVLTLNYDSNASPEADITLTFTATDGPECDTKLTVDNTSGARIELIAYPVHFAVQRSTIEAMYMPIMEGMRLLPPFFAERDYGHSYPGQMFADFGYADLTTGSLAIYGIHEPTEALKSAFWFIFRDSANGGSNKFHHDFTTDVAPGTTWTSPTIVFSIGSTLDEAMDTYWARSGHDTMPMLEEKLGTSLFEKLAGAVLFKTDFLQGGWTFSTFLSYLPNVPANNLIHIVAFWQIGFDNNYPDYLPPRADLGSQNALANLVSTARSQGHLVMPYTNPTWWDPNSPSWSSLTNDVVLRDRNNNLISENYGPNFGHVVSPCDPAVIARQDKTRTEFTQTIPCDFLFEDQVGARNQPRYGAHPSCADATSYHQYMVELAERSASFLPIMSEGGFDRLSHHEAGFCLSYTIGFFSYPDNNFSIYPMAPLWAHENLYFNAHNLGGPYMANDLSALTYYLSIGYSLSYSLPNGDLDWVNVLDVFQKHNIAPLVGKGMTSFDNFPTAGQTVTTFADGTTVSANLTNSPWFRGGNLIAPDGFLMERAGRVTGGVVTVLYGQPLAGGEPHYLSFVNEPYRITIRQPRGDNTPLNLPRPTSWTDDARIMAVAVTENGSTFGRTPTITPSGVGVNYENAISGQPTEYFRLIYCRPGDADCDGDIDVDDYTSFEECLTGPDLPIDPTPPQTQQSCRDGFDGDLDDDVDLVDFAALQQGFDGAL